MTVMKCLRPDNATWQYIVRVSLAELRKIEHDCPGEIPVGVPVYYARDAGKLVFFPRKAAEIEIVEDAA